MDSLDVDGEVRRKVPRGYQGCDAVTGRERCRPAVVDVDPVRRRRGKFVPTKPGVHAGDDRPGVRVGGSFAGEVPGIKFLKGGVQVVEVEHDERRDPFVGVDLDNVKDIDLNLRLLAYRTVRLRTRCSPRVAMTSDITGLDSKVGDGPQMFAISPSRPCRIPAFTTRRRSSMEEVVRQYLRQRRPNRGPQSKPGRARLPALPRFPAAAWTD